MKFVLNNQAYVLHYDDEKSRWYLVTTGVGGRMKAIPVINDDEQGFIPTMVVPIGDGGQASMN